MRNNEIDIYSIPMEMMSVAQDDRFIKATKAVCTSSFLVGQYLKPFDNLERSDFTSFLYQNKQLMMIIFSGYLIVAILIFVLSQIINPAPDCAKRLRLVLYKILFIDSVKSPCSFKVALIFLFFHIFMFFCQNFLFGSVKTEKVTIDTSAVIDTTSKLIRSEKTMVVNHEQDKSMNLALEHSFLGRLAKKRRMVLNPTVTKEERNALLTKRMDSYFFMAIHMDLYYVMYMFSSYSELGGLVAFIRSQIYRESFLRVFYLRRSLEDEKKRFIHNR